MVSDTVATAHFTISQAAYICSILGTRPYGLSRSSTLCTCGNSCYPASSLFMYLSYQELYVLVLDESIKIYVDIFPEGPREATICDIVTQVECFHEVNVEDQLELSYNNMPITIASESRWS